MSSSPETHGTAPVSKRKRNIIPEDEDEKLEIDVNLPEPPSKKAKRKEKKGVKRPKSSIIDDEAAPVKTESANIKSDDASVQPVAAAKRSEHGVWVGNLPFSVTKESLRQFFRDEGGIDEEDITRVHLPSGEKGQNKGFAYVDVTSPSVLQVALALSEKMIGGRRVLIKNAKSFEGRPEANAAGKKSGASGNTEGKEPSQRIFVGNLSFDVTKAELADHFAQAGAVEEVFVATFQDTGKCKGFGWIRFATIEAAENAVRGFIFKGPEDQGEEGEQEGDGVAEDEPSKAKPAKAKKPRKWFINRIHGRTLRCEFAEDPQTRYKKRFGQKATASDGVTKEDSDAPVAEDSRTGLETSAATARPRLRKLDKDERQDERRKRHDARRIAPGKALANAHRATGAIVAGAGTKVTFD